jgi:hypothetical protein
MEFGRAIKSQEMQKRASSRATPQLRLARAGAGAGVLFFFFPYRLFCFIFLFFIFLAPRFLCFLFLKDVAMGVVVAEV